MSYPTFSSLFQGAGNAGQETQNQPQGAGGISQPEPVQAPAMNPWSSVAQGQQQSPYDEQLNTWATLPRNPQQSSGGKA